VDGPESSTMPGSHILVEAPDGIRTCELAVFLVHVVCTRTRVVANPDTEVLDLQWLLFVNLQKGQYFAPNACLLNGCKGSTHNVDTNDFTIGLFDLLQLSESGFSSVDRSYRIEGGRT
jgi:hypothetical protein